MCYMAPVHMYYLINVVHMHCQDQSLEQALTMPVPVVMSFLSPLHLNFPLSLVAETILRVSCKFKYNPDTVLFVGEGTCTLHTVQRSPDFP